MQLIGICWIGPRLGADAGYCFGVELAEVGRSLGVEPTPAHHGLGPALLQRRVVEIGIRPCRQHLEGKRRGFGQIARDHTNSARLETGKQALEPANVHGIVQAVRNGLSDQWMIGDHALADKIFGASELIGKDGRDQILSSHTRELRRHLLAAAEARQSKRHAGNPSPARDEHGRIEQGLWYRARTVDARQGTRKSLIVALARKLLIELWRFVPTGQTPVGVEMRPV